MRAGYLTVLPSVLLLVTASVAAGQQATPQPPPPPGPAALSVPNPLSGLRPAGADIYQLPDRSDRFHHLPGQPTTPPIFFPGVYVPGPYYFPFAGVPQYPAPARTEPRPVSTRGGLAIETLPGTAQVFIDGFYVGEAEAFGLRGRPLDLSAGAHRVELRAPGFEPLMFNALIAPNDVFHYRGDLQSLSSTKTVVVAPSRPPVAKTLYVIPNCYAGDKPPKAALPPGCNRKNLRTQ